MILTKPEMAGADETCRQRSLLLGRGTFRRQSVPAFLCRPGPRACEGDRSMGRLPAQQGATGRVGKDRPHEEAVVAIDLTKATGQPREMNVPKSDGIVVAYLSRPVGISGYWSGAAAGSSHQSRSLW
jgi:hypothetical protein